jgi:beta-lactamase superfamily II metal-dependent hydrolase
MSVRLVFFPASCGDSFLVECPTAGGVFRILIDGGTPGTASVISEHLKKDGPCPTIDLVVVTHIDNDHIGGIVSLLKDKEINAAIKEVWFNAVSRLGAPLPANIQSLSVGQGIDLEKALYNDTRWNTQFGMDPISLLADNSPRHVPLAEGVAIYILSPGAAQLDELKRNWENEAAELEKKPKKKEKLPPGVGTLSGATKDVGRLLKEKFIQDKAFANGSSIAFLLEADEKMMLFTGDAFPTVMVEAAEKYKTGPIDVEVFKVSHHGSSGNTDREIVKKFPATRYLISTDGTHDHPDDETIARILGHSDPKSEKTIVCNYPDTLDNWAGVDFGGAWSTKIVPNENGKAIEIYL